MKTLSGSIIISYHLTVDCVLVSDNSKNMEFLFFKCNSCNCWSKLPSWNYDFAEKNWKFKFEIRTCGFGSDDNGGRAFCPRLLTDSILRHNHKLVLFVGNQALDWYAEKQNREFNKQHIMEMLENKSAIQYWFWGVRCWYFGTFNNQDWCCDQESET